MLFVQGVLRMPAIWQAWIGVLVLVNFVGPFFFLSESAAIVTLVAMITGGLVGEALTQVQGFTKLLGLMHGSWVPMFVFQLIVLFGDEPTGAFQTWLIASVIVSGISLVIDVADVAAGLDAQPPVGSLHYLVGDR